MATIALENMRFYGKHGFYEEERILGNEFLLDVTVDANTMSAAMTDDLFSTVNYETIYFICQSEMKKPVQLIETLAQNIVSRINEQFDNVTGVKVKVKKLNPPLGGRVGSASVEVGVGSLGGGSSIGGGLAGGFGGGRGLFDDDDF